MWNCICPTLGAVPPPSRFQRPNKSTADDARRSPDDSCLASFEYPPVSAQTGPTKAPTCSGPLRPPDRAHAIRSGPGQGGTSGARPSRDLGCDPTPHRAEGTGSWCQRIGDGEKVRHIASDDHACKGHRAKRRRTSPLACNPGETRPHRRLGRAGTWQRGRRWHEPTVTIRGG